MNDSKTTDVPSIIEASADATLLNVEHSAAQAALLKGIYRLRMNEEESAIFEEATGRKELDLPEQPFKVTTACCGRRGGKSRTTACICVYEACIAKHEIPPNERGVVTILAPTERQARATFKVVHKMIQRSLKLREMIENDRSADNEIQLTNSIDIRVEAANQKTVRGSLIVCAVIEEACFLRDSDSGTYNLEEILDALTPSLLTLNDSKLILISSPWAKTGPVWESYEKRFERPGELFFKLPSWKMNPTLSPALLWIERKRMGDAKYFREYGAEFSDSVSQLIPSELIDKAIVRGVREFPSQSEIRAVAGLDPSSKGNDSFGFALAHKAKDGKIILDLSMGWKPPGNGQFLDYGPIVPTIVERMNAYGATKVFSDQVCAAALASMFQKYGMRFEQVSTFGTRAADLYRTVRQLFVAGKVVLPENPELIAQLKQLQEILADGGKSIVQAKSGHDDLAVSACLAIYEASLIPEPREPICTTIWANDAPQRVNSEIPLGPGDEYYPESHRFGPERWWRRV